MLIRVKAGLEIIPKTLSMMQGHTNGTEIRLRVLYTYYTVTHIQEQYGVTNLPSGVFSGGWRNLIQVWEQTFQKFNL